MKKQLQTISSLLARKLGTLLLLGGACFYQAKAQVNVTATAGTTGPTVYTTVNAALAAITAGTHQGDVVITVTANTTEPTFSASNQLVASGVGSAVYSSVTIKPQGDVIVGSAATPSANRGILEFIGADNITIDGDDPLTFGSRNLTFQVSTTSNDYTSALRFSSSAATATTGCRDIVIKNCIIIGGRNSATSTLNSFGITASGQSSGTLGSTTSSAADNDHWTVENNEFKRAYYGFHAYGDATYLMDSLVLRNNKFGSSTSAQNIGLVGAYIGYTALTANSGSAIIEGNEIQGGDYGATGWSANISGIQLTAGNSGAIIRQNNIHDVNQPSTGGYGAYGILLSSSTSNANINIYNNFIRDIKVYTYQNSTTSTWQPIGIFVSGSVTALKINHNTIVMSPQLEPTTTYSSHGVLVSSGATLSEFNNNIIINNHNSSAGYAVTSNANTNFSSASMDKNNYKVTGANIGYYNGANRTSLANWKTATGKDLNSFNVSPLFVSATDLRLQAGVKSSLESSGAVTSVTTDIDGNVRPGPAGSINGGALGVDIGAHESDMIPDLFVADSVIPSQVVQIVAPGDTSKAVLNFKVFVSGAVGTAINLNSVLLNTIGSTNAGDILAAKVFYTGTSNTFSTNVLYGSTATPNGSFSVTGTQSLTAGMHNFWVAYDINASVTSGNLVDVRLDSVGTGVTYLVPVNGDPSGAVSVINPMTYISSEVTQSNVSRVYQGENNREVLGLRLVMSSVGSTVTLNSFDLNLNGTTDTADIRNIKVWYTGHSSTFATTTQYGATLPYAPVAAAPFSFNVPGSLSLLNDTNYFWVTYDIKPTAVAFNLIDGEITQVTIAGVPMTPTVIAPAGTREIRTAYCTPAYSNGCGTDYIANVSLGALSNASGCTGPLTFYNTATIPNLTRGISYPMSVTYGPDGSQFGRVWIDFNDDGDFSDPGEDMGIQSPANPGGGGTAVFTITIPCTANLGHLRLRIRGGDDTQPGSGQSCGASGSNWGEAEDYIINVLDNPLMFNYTTAQQTTGVVAPGTNDQVILRVPIQASGCGVGTITEMRFTNTSTVASDITNAKLYRTSGNTFNTSNLRATIPSPTGQFTFVLTDTLNLNDTTNYWLAYDVALSGATYNVIDATYDSTMFLSNYYTPVNGDPAGNVQIILPMTYVGSDVIQNTTTNVYFNETNREVVGLRLIMSSTGAPVFLNSLDLNLNGTTDTADISNIKVWYTGHSSTFATTTQFGATSAYAPVVPAPFGLTVTGSQSLLNDTNYLWVSYDIKGTATLNNEIDAEITEVTIDAVPQIPSVTSPAGIRVIKAPYCVPTYTTGKTDGDLISDISISGTTLSNNSGTAQVNPPYTYFAGAPNLTATFIQGGSYTVTVTVGTWGNQGLAAWIDYNGDGTFTANEKIGFTNGTIGSGSGGLPIPLDHTTTFGIQLSCESQPGVFRMRVRDAYGVSGAAMDPCTNYGWGETEDYDVTILVNPLVYQTSTTIQSTVTTMAGATNVPVLRIPVKTAGCDIGTANTFNFTTAGSTDVADIAYAKLLSSGTSPLFSNATVIDSIATPSGSFSFMVNDTLTPNDTTNYWLAYDITPSATVGNVLDATVDSIFVLNGWHIPTVTNPLGNVYIDAPMAYISSTTTQNTFGVEAGTASANIIGVDVVMSATGVPVNLTSFDVSTLGTTSLTDITNLKVWYTGASNTFATTTQFGSTVATPAASQTISGTQTLLNGMNHFWITYDVPGAAVIGNFVDAEITALVVDGISEIPTVTAPAGAREIRPSYCASGATSTADSDIGTVLLTSGNDTIVYSSNGCGLNVIPGAGYTNNTATAGINVERGAVVKMNLCYSSASGNDYDGYAAIYIDYNGNGTWDAGELVWGSQTAFGDNGNYAVNGLFIIPNTASLISTRMRVVFWEGAAAPLTLTEACGTFNWGETEDYTITILPAPPSTSFTWNQTVSGSYGTPSNWTPARTNRNINHELVFNAGGSADVTNVEDDILSALTIDNATVVNLTAPGVTELTLIDELNLTSGKLTTGTNVIPVVGTSPATLGVINGTGKVEGALAQWIAASTGSYTYPMVNGSNNRTATISYTTAPTTGGKLTVRYVAGAPGKNGLPLTDGALTLDSIAKEGIWRSTASAGLSGGSFDVVINADNIVGVNNYATMALVARANSLSPWVIAGTNVTTTGTNSAMLLSRIGLTSYGELGLAGDAANNPLPVTLTTFTATAKAKDALLNWTTASETNNRGFEIERSLDGRSFEKVGFVNGAGNSNRTLNYNFTDVAAFNKSGVWYYRLKQVDFDGKFTYSQIVRVSVNTQQVTSATVYPNPFKSEYTLSFSAAKQGVAVIEMMDMQGRVVSSTQVDAAAGVNAITVTEAQDIKAGVYFVKVTINGESQTLKLVKE